MDRDIGSAALVALDEQCQEFADRRSEGERRRGPRSWSELRARRDGIEIDRRRRTRRGSWLSGLLLAFWQRD